MSERKLMDNTVGRTDAVFCDLTDKHNAYIFGLWCADGYHRTSSIGLTSVDVLLVENFKEFLLQLFPRERIKTRIYSREREKGHYWLAKAAKPAYQIYVNCRPFLRFFSDARLSPQQYVPKLSIPAYFAGRFDGDGSIAKDGRSDLRIAYGYLEEAKNDALLLPHIGITPKVYQYKKAKTYVLYVSRYDAIKFLHHIAPYSVRLKKQHLFPRET